MIDLEIIPNKPGCYLYKDKTDKIIYVGKAKDLKKRISSYFSSSKKDEKTKRLIENLVDFDFIVTDSETEALVLENTLIKKHLPKYNILLKDSKRYGYIKVTTEKFPKMVVGRDKKETGDLFGPFVSAADREFVRTSLIKAFRLRTCRRLPKKACLRYHIGLCSAPCIGKINVEDYNKDVESAKKVLKGSTKSLKNKLSKEMDLASKGSMFERAIIFRDQLKAIEYLETRQKMERDKKYDEDVINYMINGSKAYITIFNVYKGTLENKQEFIVDYSEDFFEEFVSRYYSEEEIPNELIVPSKLGDGLIEYLSQLRGSKVRCVVPKKGVKKELLELVLSNISASFLGKIDRVESLQKELDLNFKPSVIECFDISHLGGKNTVASMVQFVDGVPNKTEYRRFKMKTYEGNDDFLGMMEVVRRRYSRLKNEGSKMPDLVVVDGGKGQLNVAVSELVRIGVKVPIISLAKKFEEIYIPGLMEPIQLGAKSKGLLMLREIRDEAHRFAVSYQRVLRNKEYFL